MRYRSRFRSRRRKSFGRRRRSVRRGLPMRSRIGMRF